MASTWPWCCLVCKKVFPSYEDSHYLCVCKKNQLVCKKCVKEKSLTYDQVSELFGEKHYVRDISKNISEAVKNVINAQQKMTVMGKYLERRKTNGWVRLTHAFFYPKEGRRPSVVQGMKQDVLFRNRYKIPLFVDVLTHIMMKTKNDIKVGILLDKTLCKIVNVKKGESMINFFAPLFLLKDRLMVRILPRNQDVRISMTGFIINNNGLKKALSKEKLWIPDTKITIDGKKACFSSPRPLRA